MRMADFCFFERKAGTLVENDDRVLDLVIAAEDGYFYYMKNPQSL